MRQLLNYLFGEGLGKPRRPTYLVATTAIVAVLGAGCSSRREIQHYTEPDKIEVSVLRDLSSQKEKCGQLEYAAVYALKASDFERAVSLERRFVANPRRTTSLEYRKQRVECFASLLQSAGHTEAAEEFYDHTIRMGKELENPFLRSADEARMNGQKILEKELRRMASEIEKNEEENPAEAARTAKAGGWSAKALELYSRASQLQESDGKFEAAAESAREAGDMSRAVYLQTKVILEEMRRRK